MCKTVVRSSLPFFFLPLLFCCCCCCFFCFFVLHGIPAIVITTETKRGLFKINCFGTEYRRQDNYKLRFANDTDGLAGQEQELVKSVNHLEEAFTAYGIQISAEKTQLMTNNTNGISTDITIDNKKLETVRSFKYLGALVWDEDSKREVLSRIAPDYCCCDQTKSHLDGP